MIQMKGSLTDNENPIGQSKDGVWLLFGKAGGPKTIKAREALEEALCFGWIDGHIWMQRQMSGGKNESPGWWTDSIKT